MPRPLVEIRQEVANVILTPANPDLSTCIVGPAYKVVEYPENRGAGVAYAPNGSGGWGDNSFTITAGAWPDPDGPASTIAWSAFGFGAEHDIDTAGDHPPAAFLEAVYYLVKNDIAANDVTIGADAHTLTFAAADLSSTSPAGGVKIGDKVVIQSNMPQVLVDLDASAAFLTDVSVGDVVTFNNTQNDSTVLDAVGAGAFTVLQVIDDNRLLLADADGAGGVFDTLAGAELNADSGGGDSRFGYTIGALAVVDQRASLLKHVPVAVAVQSVSSQTELVVAANLRFKTSNDAGSRASCYIERSLAASTNGNAPGWAVPAGEVAFDDTNIVLGGGGNNQISMAVPEGTAVVTRATVQVEARGLINNLADFITHSSIPSNNEFADIGKVHHKNPLGLAMYVALSNAGATNLQCLAIASDDTAGYTAARSKINANKSIYCIVPLSTDLANVIAPFKNAAVAQSAPEKGNFRHVIGASAGLPSFKYVGPVLGAETDTGSVVAGNPGTFSDLNAQFVTDGVVVGDTLVVTGGETYVVSAVVNENALTITDVGGGEVAETANSLTYTVQRSISSSTTQQKDELLARIASAGSKRLTMVYAGSCKVLGTTGLPAYYLAAAVGGMNASLAPHQPFNQIGIAGVEQVFDTNLHFSDDEIDALGDGGYYVFVQDSVAGLPYVVHQVTTGQIDNPGVQEYAELSVVRNFDYVSLVMKGRLEPFVGVWNFIPEAVNSVSDTINSAIESLRTDFRPKIGSPLLSGKISSIGASAADSSAMETYVEVTLPKVLNKLIVHLVSQ